MLKIFLTGALALGAFLVVMRIIRKRHGRDYEESRKAFEKRLRKTDAQMREHDLSATAAEQLRPVAAAIREMLELAGKPAGFALLEEGRIIRLRTPAGEILIEFGFSRIRGASRRELGKTCGCWRISGPADERREHPELAGAASCLKDLIFRQKTSPDAAQAAERAVVHTQRPDTP